MYPWALGYVPRRDKCLGLWNARNGTARFVLGSVGFAPKVGGDVTAERCALE